VPVFPKPTVTYTYDVAGERRALRTHKALRKVPDKARDILLLGSWNIANFGAQSRRECDNQLIAELLSRFDISAIQECRENFADLYDVVQYMGRKYRVVMSDAGGNNERLAFIYDVKKLNLLDEIGEINFAPSLAKTVTLPGANRTFAGFDRSPYLASFNLTGTPLSVQLLNVHLFFGSDSEQADIERRALETTGVAKWTTLRISLPPRRGWIRHSWWRWVPSSSRHLYRIVERDADLGGFSGRNVDRRRLWRSLAVHPERGARRWWGLGVPFPGRIVRAADIRRDLLHIRKRHGPLLRVQRQHGRRRTAAHI
jgi:hypothetical protein